MIKLKKRQKKALLGAAVSLVIVLFGYFQSPDINKQAIQSSLPGNYRVIKVEDGDTITVDMNGTEERIRFIGVDTPETRDPRKPVQCFGHAASGFTRKLIGANPVRLESDPLSSNRDRYDRLLRYVYLPDDRLVQAEIIKAGYGFAYTSFPFTKSDEFIGYQRDAREHSRGLWASCEPQENEFGGFESNPE